MITTQDIKTLRETTGVSVMQCKQALEEARGDREKALEILRRKSRDVAAKKSGRALGAGVVQAYIHNTRGIGAMVLLSCETDFVAKNEEFVRLAYDIAMHTAAADPEFLVREEADEATLTTLRESFKEAESAAAEVPEDARERAVLRKLDEYFKERALLEQPYVKDPQRSIGNLIEEATQKFGEKIALSKFVRFSTGN